MHPVCRSDLHVFHEKYGIASEKTDENLFFHDTEYTY